MSRILRPEKFLWVCNVFAKPTANLFPWQFHGSVGSRYCKIETLEYLVGIGAFPPGVGGGELLPYISHIDMCRPRGNGFCQGGYSRFQGTGMIEWG